MPVEIVARHARQLEAHHDANLAARDGRDDVAEADARLRQSPAAPLIFVDDDDAVLLPAKRRGLLCKTVLEALALEVASNLAQR